MKQKPYNLLVLLAFVALAIPLLATMVRKNDAKPDLAGLVISDEKPEFSWSDWLSGDYQALREDYSNDHWAFKELAVRLNNQLYYDLFNQIRVKGFVAGKDNYVISEATIFSVYGDNYAGDQKISERVRKLKVIQDTLHRKGIDLLLLLIPGKGEMCIEQIEDKYKHPFTKTNYSAYKQQTTLQGVNTLDLASWFQKLKPGSPYPLFTRFGHHWSYYAECLAVDTILHHIEALHKCDMPEFGWTKIDVVDTARSRDNDVLNSMNLYRNPPQNQQLAYPEITFEYDTLKNRTRVLTIGDSYWYGPVYMQVPVHCMNGGQFWYYNNKVIPSPVPGEKMETWQLDLKQYMESNQVIMLAYSNPNLEGLGNNFIEDAYEMYTSPKTYYARMEKEKSIKTYQKQIRETPLMLKKATRESETLQIPLDSAIRKEAMRLAGVH